MANTAVASNSHIVVQFCSLLFYQSEDEMKTRSSKMTWSSLYPMTWVSLAKNKAVLHLTSHMSPGPKPWKFPKKRMRFLSLCRPGTLQNVNSNPSDEAHMLFSTTCIQVTIVNKLFLSVKYELLVPWKIHWAALKIRTEKNKLGTYFFTFLFLHSLTLCIVFYLQTQLFWKTNNEKKDKKLKCGSISA